MTPSKNESNCLSTNTFFGLTEKPNWGSADGLPQNIVDEEGLGDSALLRDRLLVVSSGRSRGLQRSRRGCWCADRRDGGCQDQWRGERDQSCQRRNLHAYGRQQYLWRQPQRSADRRQWVSADHQRRRSDNPARCCGAEHNNNGPSDDPSVAVADTFPTDLDCTWTSIATGGATGNTPAGSGDLAETISLPAGSAVTYSATCSIDPAATGTLANTATIVSSVTDPTPGNNAATDADTVLTASADLAITKTDGVTTAVPGQVLTYTIVVTQAGPSDAPMSIVSDAFPAGLSSISWTCSASAGSTCTSAGSGDISDVVNMAAGSTLTYTALATVNDNFVGELTNTASASVAPGIVDSDPTNNSASESTTVTSSADLVALKEVSGDYVEGRVAIYTVTVFNSSPSAQLDNPGDEFVDTLPPDLTLLSAVASSGTVGADPSLNTVTWNGAVPGGGTIEIFIEARINQGLAGATISNQGQIFFDGDGDGINELSLPTDDPGVVGTGDPTAFRVLTILEIPTLDGWGLILLALALGWLGILVLRTGNGSQDS